MRHMEGQQFSERREEIFSKAVKAGNRTYFFDVKETKSGQRYLTITESKRRFNNEQGKFFYEKHKLFLFREDFEKFIEGLDVSIRFIEMGGSGSDSDNKDDFENTQATEEIKSENQEAPKKKIDDKAGHIDLNFEDLGNDAD